MKISIIVLLLSFPFYSFSQDTLNHSYFSYLRKQLESDKDVKKIKFEEKMHKNGMIGSQTMYVKLRSDKKNRYWHIGKHFCFYETGQLYHFENIDIRTKTLIDTTFYYHENGELLSIIVYNNNSKRSSISCYYPSFLSRMRCFCEPDTLNIITYNDDNTRTEKKLMYNYNSNNRLYDFYNYVETVYNSDNTVVSEIKQIDGVRFIEGKQEEDSDKEKKQ